MLPNPEIDSTFDSTLQPLWEHICHDLSPKVGDQVFRTWFVPVRPVRLDAELEELVLGVPGEFHREWMVSRFSDTISECCQRVLGSGYRISFVVLNGKPLEDAPATLKEPVAQVRSAVPVRAKPSPASHKIDPEFCFDTFVDSEANRFARSAAMAVAIAPGGSKFNPLLIHGGVGLGKTHLLHAIANLALHKNPDIRPILTTSEQFTSEFIRAVQRDKKLDFADQYAGVDILLVDDVQFFMGKEQTQRQFFHTFNSLINSGKQIVMTSDRSPHALDGLDERLRSRFGQGLVVDVQPPEYETRAAILRTWAERDGVKLPAEVEDFLASHITSNIRNLRGAVIRLLAIASLEQSDLTVSIARRVLHDLLNQPRGAVTFDRVVEVVGAYFQITPEQFVSKSRKQPLAEARMIVMALGCELTGLSLNAVGARLGGRDHTTILHGKNSVRERSERDLEFRRLLESFQREIETGITA